MTSITIRTHLDAGISASQGGGRIRIQHTLAAGPLNLLRAARRLPEHRAMMTRAYGNIGCGASWLQIDGVTERSAYCLDGYRDHAEGVAMRANAQRLGAAIAAAYSPI